MGGIMSVAFAPLVKAEEQSEWVEYSIINQRWIEESKRLVDYSTFVESSKLIVGFLLGATSFENILENGVQEGANGIVCLITSEGAASLAGDTLSVQSDGKSSHEANLISISSKKMARLVDWNFDVLLRLLKQIAAA
jgi:hypothetical protein